MEHFSLPIGLWFVGTLISIFCFLAELIIHYYIYKKEVPMATKLESETSQMSKHLGEIVLKKFRAGRLPDMEGAEVDQVQVSEVPDKLVQNNTEIEDTSKAKTIVISILSLYLSLHVLLTQIYVSFLSCSL